MRGFVALHSKPSFLLLSLWKICRLVSVDLCFYWQHDAWDWRNSHHALGCFLPGRLLQRREHSILFGFGLIFTLHCLCYLLWYLRLCLHTFLCGTVFNLISCKIWAELHHKELNPLFCVSVCTSLHPYCWNPRTNVWVYAWLLPHQNLCGHWIRGFRYGSMFIICFKHIS